MGSWGYKALQSDEGLDIKDYFDSYVAKNQNVNLCSLINMYIEKGFLPKSPEAIEFLFDKTYVAIAELLIEFKENKTIKFENESLEIHDFTFEEKDILYLIKNLEDILNGVPDEDGIREYTELFKKVKGWKGHVQSLLMSLKMEL